MSCVIDDEIGVGEATDVDPHVRRTFAALEVLASADIESMDRASLESVVAARRTVVAFCDAIDIRVARRSKALAAEGRSEPAADMLREGGRRSGREAAAAAGRQEVCEQLSSFENAVADGSVSAGHVDALANVTGRLNDEERAEFATYEQSLLGHARRSSVEEFARACRHLSRNLDSSGDDGESELARQRAKNNIRQWVDRHTGMHHFHAEIDPESGAKVWSAINNRLRTLKHQQQPADANDRTAVQPLTHEQLEAQAFIELICGSAAVDRRVPEVIALIDLGTLIDGMHDDSVCETSNGVAVTPETVRRWCCEANIIPVVLGSDGEVLDVGAGSRLATPGQRRATMAMYRTCAFPGCQVPVDRCEIHHVDDWLHSRRTDLDNLTPLCCQHHHVIHEGGWTLTMAADRTITVTRPDGVVHFCGNTIDRRSPTARAG